MSRCHVSAAFNREHVKTRNIRRGAKIADSRVHFRDGPSTAASHGTQLPQHEVHAAIKGGRGNIQTLEALAPYSPIRKPRFCECTDKEFPRRFTTHVAKLQGPNALKGGPVRSSKMPTLPVSPYSVLDSLLSCSDVAKTVRGSRVFGDSLPVYILDVHVVAKQTRTLQTRRIADAAGAYTRRALSYQETTCARLALFVARSECTTCSPSLAWPSKNKHTPIP